MIARQPGACVRTTCMLLILALFLLAPAPTQGQIKSWGLKTGLTSMTGTGDGLRGDGVSRNTGFLVGGTMTIELLDDLSLRPEVLLVRKGWTTDLYLIGGGGPTTVNLDYLEIPVLAEAHLGSVGGITAQVHAGPTMGIRVNSGYSVEGHYPGDQDAEPGERLRETDIGVVLGGSASGTLGSQIIRMDLRYRLGVRNINQPPVYTLDGQTSSPPPIRNRGFTIAVGLSF